MKKTLKCILLVCTLLSILACSAGRLLTNQKPTAQIPVIVKPPPTPLPPNIFQEGGPPLPPASVTIKSQISYTNVEDINNFISSNVISDSGALDVLNWARDQGYYPQAYLPVQAEKAVFSNDVTIYGVGFAGDAGQPIGFVRFTTLDGKGISMMARMEGDKDNPILVLFNRDGQVRYTSKGILVDEARNIDGIFPVSLRIGDNQQTSGECTGPSTFETWKKCIKNNVEDWKWFTAQCLPALVAAEGLAIATAGWATFIGLVVTSIACLPVALYCVDQAQTDYPPKITADIFLIPNQKVTICSEENQYAAFQAYQVTVKIEDDRDPAPVPPGYADILPSSYTRNYDAKDCANQWTNLKVTTPKGSPEVIQCPEGQVCRQQGIGLAACEARPDQPTQAPQNPLPEPEPAGPQIVAEHIYKGYWSAVSVWITQENRFICDETRADSVFWSLQFYSDGKIVLYHCQGNTDVKTDCRIEFQQDKNDPQHFLGTSNPAYQLEFQDNDLTRVYLEYNSFTQDNKPIFCAEEFNQDN